MTKLYGKVEKGWGHEQIFCSTDEYCGKLLVFEKEGAQFSMHFHSKKVETWYVSSGKFLVSWINTENAKIFDKYLNVGDVWHNVPLMPHRLTCIIPGTIIEVSTPDSVEDNYRVMPGDSQQKI